jgi:hypothetical protein
VTPAAAIVVDATHAAILVAAGVIAGFVNTLAGGGSAVMIPALLLLGMPATVANATTRVAILFQSATGAAEYARAERLPASAALDVVPPAVIGAVGGALVATRIPVAVLEPMLLATMALMALLVFVRPETLAPPPGVEVKPVRGAPGRTLFVVAAGFYGGVLQVGVGFVLLALLSGVLRYDLVRANALKALVVAVYTTAALAVFVAHGLVAWLPALALTVGNVAGAWVGARFALRRGAKAVRVVLVVMIVVTCAYVALR